jgi:hypothetical protein
VENSVDCLQCNVVFGCVEDGSIFDCEVRNVKNVDYLGRPSGASPDYLRKQMERHLQHKQAMSDSIIEQASDRHERIQNLPEVKPSKYKQGLLGLFRG